MSDLMNKNTPRGMAAALGDELAGISETLIRKAQTNRLTSDAVEHELQQVESIADDLVRLVRQLILEERMA